MPWERYISLCFGYSAQSYFSLDIEGYCEILLRRLMTPRGARRTPAYRLSPGPPGGRQHDSCRRTASSIRAVTKCERTGRACLWALQERVWRTLVYRLSPSQPSGW